MISSIRLKNWRTHKDTSMEFGHGINLLIGVMGSGKSSVMDAISFALFGTFPALKRGTLKIESLIMNRPSQESSGEVRLTLEIDGDRYEITRTIQKRGSSATLVKNGDIFQTQPERVTEEVSRLLKVDYDVFSRAIYSEQNGLLYFLDITKSERKRQIDNMLGLDQFAMAEERVTTVINSIRSMLKDEEHILANIDIESMNASTNKSKDELAEEIGILEKARAELELRTKDLDSAKEKLGATKAEYNRRVEIAAELERTKSRKEVIEKELKGMGAPNKDEDKVGEMLLSASAEEEAASGAHEVRLATEKEIVGRIAGFRADLSHAEKSFEEKKKILAELGDSDPDRLKLECEALDTRIDALSKEHILLERKVTETGEWINELRKHISVCPVCEREIDAQLKETLLKGKDQVISETLSEARILESEIKKLRTERSARYEMYNNCISLGKRLAQYAQVEQHIEGLKAMVAKSEKELEDNSSSKTVAELALRKARERLETLRSAKERAERRGRMSAELAETAIGLNSLEKALASAKVGIEELNSAQDKYAAESKEAGIARTKMENSAALVMKLGDEVRKRERELAQLSSVKDRIRKRSYYLENLVKFKKGLGSASGNLRSELILSINEMMSRLWDDLYPYGDYRSIRINAENDDYSLEAGIDAGGETNWVPIGSVASGGEKSVACLAMRITMGMVIVPNLRWAILDEPTHNIDSNGIYRLVSVFGDSLPKILDQVFIITHDEKLKQINNAKVYLLERDKVNGSATTVSCV